MGAIKFKFFMKKAYLIVKKYLWIFLLGIGLLIGFLLWMITKNRFQFSTLLDLFDSKTAQHEEEIETLSHIHNTEVSEKNIKLIEHQKKMGLIKKEFEEKGIELSKSKEKRLEKLVAEGNENPEALSRKLAKEFGLEHG